jgi:hypothetical protein
MFPTKAFRRSSQSRTVLASKCSSQALAPSARSIGRNWMIESRLEGGVNRAKLKFSRIITTTSRVSVRNIIESAREGAKQIASE